MRPIGSLALEPPMVEISRLYAGMIMPARFAVDAKLVSRLAGGVALHPGLLKDEWTMAANLLCLKNE